MQIGGMAIPPAIAQALAAAAAQTPGQTTLKSMGAVSRMPGGVDDDGFAAPHPRKTVTIGDALAVAKRHTKRSQREVRLSKRFEAIQEEAADQEDVKQPSDLSRRVRMIGAVTRVADGIAGGGDRVVEAGETLATHSPRGMTTASRRKKGWRHRVEGVSKWQVQRAQLQGHRV